MWLVGVILFALAQAADKAPLDPALEAELASAWASGDARVAAPVFLNAFDQVSRGACAMSPYAAQLAYRAGLLDRSGYHFNMAMLIDERVGGLTENQRAVADEKRSSPGDYQAEDRLYLFSPYLEADRDPGECPEVHMPELPNAQAGQGDRAIVITRSFWQGQRANRQLTEVIVLDGYPAAEAAQLASRLTGIRMSYLQDEGWSVQSYTFAPCYQYSHRRLVQTICRPGFERETPGED